MLINYRPIYSFPSRRGRGVPICIGGARSEAPKAPIEVETPKGVEGEGNGEGVSPSPAD